MDRRAFLRGMALASAATAASSLVPGVIFGDEVERRVADAAVVWNKAPCNLCGVGCSLLIGIENGRAVAVKGDPDSPVNRGLACARGYHSVQALYGRDRLTRAMVRRDGRLVAVPLQEALELVARTLRETAEQHGKDSVAVYGSGQWTVPAAYVASKLFKGALGTNNVDSSARLGMGSVSAGLIGSFGRDEIAGSYEDIDHADVFVLWGANLAETHPVLFSRILERRQRSEGVRIVDVSTRTTRTSYAADRTILYRPHTDLALANSLGQEIVERGLADRNFVGRHVAFKRGRTNLGDGTERDALVVDEADDASWEDYVRFLGAYTPESAEQTSGAAVEDIRWLASLYGDRARKVMTIWGNGVNQHTRGTWLNNLLINLHLLVGKIGSPGNAALPLADQPNAAGVIAGAGAVADRLPSGNVRSEADRQRAARIWGVPVQNISEDPGHHALAMFRALDRGDVRFLWIQGANPMVSLPNLRRYRAAAAKEGSFLVVSDSYPTPTTDVADVVLPSALWIEAEGVYVNSERRAQHFEQMLRPPGDATSEAAQLLDVARRLGHAQLFPWTPGEHVDGVWEEYSRFHAESRDRVTPISALKARPGLLTLSVDGRETRWRYNTAYDRTADREQGAYDFYGHPDHRAWIWLRPHEAAAESPDRQYPYWLSTGDVLEHTHTGTLTRRIPTLHRAMPEGYVELNREDARSIGIRSGDTVRLVSRRGSLEIEARVDYRSQPPRGVLFATYFDEGHPVNALTLDAFCPLSGQPDYKSCAVRIERAGARATR